MNNVKTERKGLPGKTMVGRVDDNRVNYMNMKFHNKSHPFVILAHIIKNENDNM